MTDLTADTEQLAPHTPEGVEAAAHSATTGMVLDGTTGIRVSTLINIRWLAIFGQSLTLALTAILSNMPEALIYSFMAVCLSVGVNLVSHMCYRRNEALSEPQAALHLGYDLVQLSVLLFLNGGLANPFTVLLLAPVCVSASLLHYRSTIVLAAIALALLFSLGASPYTLPDTGFLEHSANANHWINMVGMGFALVFLAAYIARTSRDSKVRAQALTVMRAALAREQQLAAVGGLAAAAAHELGTPLGTIMLTARELLDQGGLSPVQRDDIEAIAAEVRRCRDILGTMSTGLSSGGHFVSQNIEALLREAAAPVERGDIRLIFQRQEGTPPLLRRRPETIHALRNIIDNALRHAESTVRIDMRWSDARLMVKVCDDGPGFNPSVLKQLGTPFVRGPRRLPDPATTNPANTAAPDTDASERKSGGLGLGLFIAETLLSHTDATLEATNTPIGGACIEIIWRRASLDRDLKTLDS